METDDGSWELRGRGRDLELGWITRMVEDWMRNSSSCGVIICSQIFAVWEVSQQGGHQMRGPARAAKRFY